MGKNPPSNVEDMGSIPGWGIKIPHTVEKLSLHATSPEPVPTLERSHCAATEDPVCQNRGPGAVIKTGHSQK